MPDAAAAADFERLAKTVFDTCGFGQTLIVSPDAGRLGRELLRRGVVVVAASMDALPDTPGGWPTVVVIASADWGEAEFARALGSVRRVVRRFLVLLLSRPLQTESRAGRREAVERIAFSHGYRKHPRYYEASPYESLNQETGQETVALERIPDEALTRFPLQALEADRLLHMDMLRETGRRSDAHAYRYHVAAQYIRPGDTVLDLACGLGYGSHVLFENSRARRVLGLDVDAGSVAYAETNYGRLGRVEFRAGNAEDLSIVPDQSADFVASFETIEHLDDPAAFLREVARVLRPGGRLMIGAPNRWVDETGRDPNPHHRQVYGWERLIGECRDLFLVEKAMAQWAGGGFKLPGAPRRWRELPVETAAATDSEWAVLLCMSNPVPARQVPYEETVWPASSGPGFHVLAFARDYRNPWLVRAMVAIGLRTESAENLKRIQEGALAESAPGSTDWGAALCGLIYGRLAAADPDIDGEAELFVRVREYASIPSPAPHQLRWQVSLLFAAAELARNRGLWDEAGAFYEWCARLDVAGYSPLLGNRTLDALFWLAIMALGRGDRPRAVACLRRTVEEARRLASGDWTNIEGDPDRPLAFGFAEMAQLLDKAARAAYMLQHLDAFDERPGVFATEAQGFFERQLGRGAAERTELHESVDRLQRQVIDGDTRAQELAGRLVAADAHAQELAQEIIRQDAHAQELAREIARQDAVAQALAVRLREYEARRKTDG